MERLFSPSIRYRDALAIENEGRLPPKRLRELNLDVSTDEFLSADRGFTYSDLCAMLDNKDEKTLAWLTPHTAVARDTAVAREGGRVVKSWEWLADWCSIFCADGKEINALARSPEHLLEIFDVVLRLLAASVVHSVLLNQYVSLDGALINAASFGVSDGAVPKSEGFKVSESGNG
jgi:hypothetical protein